VYLKHFHSRWPIHRLRRRLGISDAMKEMRFGQYLAGCGVPVPEVLAAYCHDGCEWVLTRGIEPSTPLDAWHSERLARGDGAAIHRATVALAKLIGRMHRHGLLHGDLHCGNLLVWGESGEDLVLMDLHRVWRRQRPTRRALAANLAQLMSDRLVWTTRTQRLRFLKHYLEESGGQGSLRGWLALIEPLAWRHARRIARHNESRFFTTNRYFARLRVAGYRAHVVLASKRRVPGSQACGLALSANDWRAALADPEALLTAPGAEVVKDSASSLVVRRKIAVGPHSLDVYIKRPRRKKAIRWGLDLFRLSRPLKAFFLGHALLDRHIYTAVPLAAMERRRCGFLLDSILITEAVGGGVKLNRFVSRHMPPDEPATARPLLDAPAQRVLWLLGRLLRRLGQEGFSHRDLKANNILVQWDGQNGQSGSRSPELVMVDLDGVQRHRSVSARKQFRGLMRLNVSLLDCPVVNHAGRLRMLLGYLRRPGAGRINFKPYWRMLQQWSGKKIRRQIASRQQRQRAQRRGSA
jgi:tRNA A-37 threonylcarbamoyl transferase component Bud32